MTDQEIIQGLIERDDKVTKEFFFEKCRPLFCRIINLVFSYDIDYDEFVNELYVYLMENDAQKLKGFQYRCSVYMWLKVISIRYFIKKRELMIDGNLHNPPYEELKLSTTPPNDDTAKNDVERLFRKMPTQRYAYIIRKLVIEEIEPERLSKELGITTANLYNIKHRAILQLTQVALKDIKEYGK